MEWLEITSLDELQTGDVVETPSKIVGTSPVLAGTQVRWVKHYGIVCDGNVVHNPFGGSPEVKPIEEILGDRVVTRIIRTGVSSDEIMARYEDNKKYPYQFWRYNCEDFVRSICGCSLGFDQRRAWAIGITVAVVIIIIVLMVRSTRR